MGLSDQVAASAISAVSNGASIDKNDVCGLSKGNYGISTLHETTRDSARFTKIEPAAQSMEGHHFILNRSLY
jgi:hypothetical protein